MVRIRSDFRRAQLAVAALFCLLGFQYATWASRLPAIKTRLGLSDAEVGLLLMVCGLGAATSFPLVASLTKRLGSRRLSILSALFLALLPLTLAVAPDYPVALVIVFCDGVAVACLDVAMNAQGAALEVTYQRTTMTKLHATFSGGSFCGALLASGLNALNTSLLEQFAVAAVLLLLMLGYAQSGLLVHDLPEEGQSASSDAAHEEASQAGQSEQTSKKRRRWAVPARVTLWMGCAMAFGTVVEGAMNDWSALYLKNVAKAATELTPLGIAVFSAMMVLARIFADGWRTRWGDGRVVVLGSALAGAGLLAAVLAGGTVPALLGFACVGLGIAAVTPCIYVAAAGQGADALALVAAMGTVGLLAGPGVIGFIANSSGLTWGMAAVAGSAVIVSLSTARIRWPAPARAEGPDPDPESGPPAQSSLPVSA